MTDSNNNRDTTVASICYLSARFVPSSGLTVVARDERSTTLTVGRAGWSIVGYNQPNGVKMLRRSIRVLYGLVLVAMACDGERPAALLTQPQQVSNLVSTPAQRGWIVVVPDSVRDVARTALRLTVSTGAHVRVVWTYALKGFVIDATEAEALALSIRGDVKLVTADGPITAANNDSDIFGVQPSPPSWGLDRMDQRQLPIDGVFYAPNDAVGTHLYLLDTGLNGSHTDFSGRIGAGVNFVSAPPNGDQNWSDCNGHGTHVAGIAAGTTYGVAKRATLHPVRVLDCNKRGTWAAFISGLNWIANPQNKQLPAVVNISLGGPLNAAVDQATRNIVASGIVVVAASGNTGSDACAISPANTGTMKGILTVNETDNADTADPLSNFGPCTDIYAPGIAITSAWIGAPGASQTLNGTSMAAPHVAGAALAYLKAKPQASPAQVEGAIKGNATQNVVLGVPNGTPNLLVNIIPPGFVAVAGGDQHFCGVNSSGAAYCWGSNQWGQLGDGTTLDRSIPTLVVGALAFKRIDAGAAYTCGLTIGNEVYCWGWNRFGKLGDGTTTDRHVPTRIQSSATFNAVSTGNAHVCATTVGGQLYCWGGNYEGQLGDGSSTNRSVPTLIGSGYLSVAAGFEHTCAIDNLHAAYCWGNNSDGQLGINVFGGNRSTPQPVQGGLQFAEVSAGGGHTCARTVAALVYCWGGNYHGALGNGGRTNTPVPTVISGGFTFLRIATGIEHSCGITTAHTAYCWGYNLHGSVGDGTTVDRDVPTPVSGGIAWADLSMINYTNIARTVSNAAYTWGPPSSPVPVP